MKEYHVNINGADITVLYSDKRAKELGLLKEPRPVAENKSVIPANKAVTSETKTAVTRKRKAAKE